MLLGVGAAEKMLARSHFAEHIQGLCRLREIDTLDKSCHGGTAIRIDDGLSQLIVSRPSKQPVAWIMKFTPARTAPISCDWHSYPACASGAFDTVSAPTEWNGSPSLSASVLAHICICVSCGDSNVDAPVNSDSGKKILNPEGNPGLIR